MNSTANLRFPSAEIIQNHLSDHPSLQTDKDLKDKGVFQKIGEVFANTIKSEKDMSIQVITILQEKEINIRKLEKWIFIDDALLELGLKGST